MVEVKETRLTPRKIEVVISAVSLSRLALESKKYLEDYKMYCATLGPPQRTNSAKWEARGSRLSSCD